MVRWRGGEKRREEGQTRIQQGGSSSPIPSRTERYGRTYRTERQAWASILTRSTTSIHAMSIQESAKIRIGSVGICELERREGEGVGMDQGGRFLIFSLYQQKSLVKSNTVQHLPLDGRCGTGFRLLISMDFEVGHRVAYRPRIQCISLLVPPRPLDHSCTLYRLNVVIYLIISVEDGLDSVGESQR